MHAITVSAFGPPSVLQPTEIAAPTPERGEVLVEVTGAGVGPWDAKQRDGRLGPQPFPFVPGREVSGLVAGAGDAADRFPSGAAVFGVPRSGGYADYAVAPLEYLAAAPPGLDLEAAGAVPVAACTALQGVDDHLHVGAGDRLLVAGAAGGVGSFVVQLATARGARVVATASPANHDYLRGLGADEVLDYHTEWQPGAAGVDAAFDCVGGPTWADCLAAVRDGGRAVTIAEGAPIAERAGVTSALFHVEPTTERLDAVARLIGEGRLRVEISGRFPLDHAAQAHELIDDGHTRGKLVLIPG